MGIGLPLGLIGVGILAILIETFVPAGGVIGIAGLGSIIAGIVVIFDRFGTLYGTVALLAAAVLIPVLIALYFRRFPRTFMGRRLILRDEEQTRSGPSGLAGQEGKTLTVLRPAGIAEIAGQRHTVVSRGEYIEAGQPVEVIRVEGSRIVVRKKGRNE